MCFRLQRSQRSVPSQYVTKNHVVNRQNSKEAELMQVRFLPLASKNLFINVTCNAIIFYEYLL